MEIKICTLCKKSKKLDEYYLDNRMICGRTSGCKKCLSYKSKIYKRKKHGFKPKTRNKKHTKSYYERNRDKILIRQKEYNSDPKNKKRRKNYIRKYQQKQRLNKSYVIRDNLSRRVRGAIKHGDKNQNTLDLLGCSIEQLKLYLEQQFKTGMSWDNYGMYGWHIDHIKPCSSFDLSNPAEQKICFHYTNLQPLWAKENLSKGKKSSVSIL